MSVDSILGAAEREAAQQKTSKTAEDKDMFLKLLVAQLQYQDPLNPQEDTEFIAQLAQFTQVEEMQKVNSTLDTMLEFEDQRMFTSAVNMLNQTVVGTGNSIRKFRADMPQYDDNGDPIMDDDDPEKPLYKEEAVSDFFYYRCDFDVAEVNLVIRNANGVEVYSESLPAMKAGKTYSYSWDTLDNYGNEAADGYYTIYVTAKDLDNKSQLVTTEVSGKVQAVENIGGDYYLYMYDGRQVLYKEVGMVGTTSK